MTVDEDPAACGSLTVYDGSPGRPRRHQAR